MQNTITINGLALTGLLKLAAKKDVRFYLNGIKVEATPVRTRLIASNGYVMGIYEAAPEKNCPNVVEGGYYEGIMPRAVLDKLRVTKQKHTLTLTVSIGTSRCREAVLHNYGTELKFQTVDAGFPEYQRIIPEEVTGEAGTFNPELLHQFVGMAKALGGAAHNVNLHQNGPHESALVTLDKCPEFVGVVMPMSAALFDPKGHLWARAYLNAKPRDARSR